jgi:hypothetical protein
MSGRKPKWTRAQIDKIVAARKSGVSIADIIARFKLSTATLYVFLRRGGAPIRKHSSVPHRHDSTVAPWIAAELEKLKQTKVKYEHHRHH